MPSSNRKNAKADQNDWKKKFVCEHVNAILEVLNDKGRPELINIEYIMEKVGEKIGAKMPNISHSYRVMLARHAVFFLEKGKSLYFFAPENYKDLIFNIGTLVNKNLKDFLIDLQQYHQLLNMSDKELTNKSLATAKMEKYAAEEGARKFFQCSRIERVPVENLLRKQGVELDFGFIYSQIVADLNKCQFQLTEDQIDEYIAGFSNDFFNSRENVTPVQPQLRILIPATEGVREQRKRKASRKAIEAELDAQTNSDAESENNSGREEQEEVFEPQPKKMKSAPVVKSPPTLESLFSQGHTLFDKGNPFVSATLELFFDETADSPTSDMSQKSYQPRQSK